MYEIFASEKIDLVSSLPCNNFAPLIGDLPDRFRHVRLSREENGVGISAGASLTGSKPLMLIQSTGLGNSLNALLSLHGAYRLPLPIIASWRGRGERDRNPAQIPFGKSLPEVFKAFGIPCTIIETPGQVATISTAIGDAFSHSSPHIILVSPEIWDENEEEVRLPPFNPRRRPVALAYAREFADPVLSRREAIDAMHGFFKDAIVLTTIGKTCNDLYDVEDRDLNFYVLSAMGQASAIGLGMAMNTRKNVYVLDGDGSLLMNPNVFCEIAMVKPANLTVVLLDNGTFGTTGDQQTPAYHEIDLELVARSFGIAHTRKATGRDEIVEALAGFGQGPNLVHIPIKTGKSEGKIPLRPETIKERFMKALAG